MIKITKKVKRKNPESQVRKFLESLKPQNNNIKIQYLSKGNFGETYIFNISNDKILPNNEYISSDKYLIKQFIKHPSNKEINHLIKLSNHNLIPKIYFIDKNYSIMKYIDGDKLSYFIKNNNLSILQMRLIFHRIRNILDNWHDLGFYHGDLDSLNNILITKDKEVYLIDPCLYFDSHKNIISYNRDLEMLNDRENFIISLKKFNL